VLVALVEALHLMEVLLDFFLILTSYPVIALVVNVKLS